MVHIYELSQTGLKLIEFFANNSDKQFYFSELIKKLKISKASLSKWLKKLKAEDMILSTKLANSSFYKANIENTFVKQLKITINIYALCKQFSNLKNMAEVYVYGSTARGENMSLSDIDILIISNDNEKKITKIMDNLTKNIKPLIMTPLEYAELKLNDPVLYKKIEQDKIRLV